MRCIVVAATGIALAATLAGPAAPRAAPPAVGTPVVATPVAGAASTVVAAFVAAVNAGDEDAALALVAPDACVAYGDGACFTPERLTAWWQSDIFGPDVRIEADEVTPDGDGIFLLGRWGVGGTATSAADYRFVVDDGLIVEWRLR